uniref:60S acidic ribosomal protein P2 n=1 Tax=Cyanophora paradoxa TaxID=2762 RepID=Q9SMI4_CYAPA|nr:60S acidic ribosomal protein P2 [Cyanophora paradoxa]|eukprot:tig00020830_g14458.t1
MKHVAAYLLLNLAGNEHPSAADIKKLLDSAGVAADDAKLKAFLATVEGKNVAELISKGKGKLASVAVAAAPAAGAAAPAAGGAAPAAAKKEEKKEEEEEETDMGLSLFD